MATISELNVRLGLLYKDFDKSLTAVEKRLERSGRKFSQLGNDLTLAVTAPLAAIGAAAIQQAGEIESLKLAMVSTFDAAGRSAEEATAEVEALRQAAKEPGLDFEQAVRGSIRLQGVGIAAEEARRILGEMANAIALTGGTADDLDGVTRQFSQMIAKGRVLQEDVSILAERMPRISSLMQDAFGTASVEAIRASGVGAKEFVARITEAAAVLPRVEGGIKNALVNAGSEARNSLAKLGEAINKAFDIPKTLDQLTKGLASAVQWFENLDASTQRLIVQVGAFAVAAGPVVKVIGAMQGAAAQAISIFGSFASGLKSVAGGMLTVVSSATNMRLAVIAATGGVAAIVLGIAAAVTVLSDQFDAAGYATEQFANAQKAVNEESAKEIGQLNKNINALKDVRTSTDDRKKAADALLSAYPEYLRGIDLEKASLERLNEVQNTLTQSIIRGIAERKKADAVNAIYEKQAAILLRIQEIQREGKATASEIAAATKSVFNPSGTIGGGLVFAAEAAQGVIKNLQNQVADLGKQANITAADFDKAFGLATRSIDPLLEGEYRARQSAEDARDAFLGFGDAAVKATASAGRSTGMAAGKAEEMAKAYQKAIKSIEAVGIKGEILDSEVLGEKAKEVESQMERLVEMGFGPNSKAISNLKKYLVDIRAEMAAGFGTLNTAQTAVAEIENLSGAFETLKRAQENAGSRAAVIEALRQAYPEYLRNIDLEKASLEDLARIQKDLSAQILSAPQGGGVNMSAAVDVSGAIAELSRLSNVPEIAAKIDISGALAELKKLSEGTEIAANVDISGALSELQKLQDIPDVAIAAGVDVRTALAELQKLQEVPDVSAIANIDVRGALAELQKIQDIPDITAAANIDVSTALAELQKLNLSPEIAATADVSGALAELQKLSQIPDISAVADVDISAALAELEKLKTAGVVPAKVDVSAALSELRKLADVPDITAAAHIDVSGALAELEKLNISPEVAATVDVSAALSELQKLREFPEISLSAGVDVSGALAELEKLRAVAPITAQIDTAGAVAQIESVGRALDVLRNKESGAELRAGAIKAITDAYPQYLRGIDLERAGIEKLNAVQKDLTETIIRASGEKVGAIIPQADTSAAVAQIENLRAAIAALKNTQTGDDERLRAIEALSGIYPEFIRNINLEKAGVKELTDLQNRLTETIISGAAQRGQIAGPLIDTTEAQAQVAALAASLDTLRNTSGGEGARAAAIKAITDAYPEYLANVDLEKADIAQLIALQNTLTASILKTAQARASMPQSGGAPAVPQIAGISLPSAVQSVELTGADQAIAQARAFADSLDLANQSASNLADNLAGNGLAQIQGVFAEMEAGALSFGDAITQSAVIFQEQYGQSFQAVYSAASELASGIIALNEAKAEREKELLDEEYAAKLEAAKGNANATKQINEELAAKKKEIDKKIAKQNQTVAIVQAVINTALGVTQALSSAPPPYNFILAALTAAAGAVQIATIKSQAFAEGGVVTKPTMGLVGEYPGAYRNPEIISPESKMRQVFREEAMGMYGGPTELYSIIRDDHLLLATERAAQRRGRAT